MRELSVVNLGILLLSVLHTEHGLAKEVERFGWTMFSVREMKVPLGIVDAVHGVFITVVTVRMHLWSARVSMIFIYGEQLNWLFTEHGTTEEIKRGKPQLLCRSRTIKLGLSRLCSATFEQLSGFGATFCGSNNLEQF